MNRTEKQDVIQEMQAVIQNHKTFISWTSKSQGQGHKPAQGQDPPVVREDEGREEHPAESFHRHGPRGARKKFLEAPTAMAWAQADPIPLAKTLMSFSKDNPNLKIKGAFVEGAVLSTSDVEVLSKLPGINELRAQLIRAPSGSDGEDRKGPQGSLQDVAVCISEHGKQTRIILIKVDKYFLRRNKCRISTKSLNSSAHLQ